MDSTSETDITEDNSADDCDVARANDENKEEKLGCQHYQRKCQLVGPCCGRVYTCRFCHDEKENHQLIRTNVMEVVCLVCQLKQNVSNLCTSCKTVFGNYFCHICRLYDDVDKKQFHCEDCGICRIGGKANFFHCQKCGLCIGNDSKDKHKCVENASRSNCPICLEDIHSSRDAPFPLRCGHIIHRTCYKQLLENGSYTCPLCNVSVVDMKSTWRKMDEDVAATPMPPEYTDLKVGILCRDCHKESEVPFHVVGLKCAHCGAYNTCRTGGLIRYGPENVTTEDDDDSNEDSNDEEVEEADVNEELEEADVNEELEEADVNEELEEI
ncbi:RING finger and CHY zinc finger domain-containing protein 1 [Chamberlinius hualienensis]